MLGDGWRPATGVFVYFIFEGFVVVAIEINRVSDSSIKLNKPIYCKSTIVKSCAQFVQDLPLCRKKDRCKVLCSNALRSSFNLALGYIPVKS